MNYFTTAFEKCKNTGKKGAVSELAACIWLLSNNYEVFRNVTPNGKIDIVAVKGDELIKIDVKSAHFRKGRLIIDRRFQLEAIKLGIKVLYVFGDSHCEWAEDVDENYGAQVGSVPRKKQEPIMHECLACRKKFMGGNSAKRCIDCRPKRSDTAPRNRL